MKLKFQCPQNFVETQPHLIVSLLSITLSYYSHGVE